MQENIQEMVDAAPELVMIYGMKIVMAVVVFVVGKVIAAWVAKTLAKGMALKGIDSAVAAFVKNIAFCVMYAVVIIAALGQLGVQTAAFVAVVGAAGLAVGLALQGSLANFAAGVLLILFRPFKAGDYVEAGGTAGVIRDISIFQTTMLTPCNKTVIVPNGAIMGNNITNYSTQSERRLDLVIGVSYSSNLELVKQELMNVVQADERVLKDKDVTIGVAELANSSINLVCRPWVKTSDYWPLKFDLLENIKKRFDEVGIEIPFPQMDVHLQKEG